MDSSTDVADNYHPHIQHLLYVYFMFINQVSTAYVHHPRSARSIMPARAHSAAWLALLRVRHLQVCVPRAARYAGPKPVMANFNKFGSTLLQVHVLVLCRVPCKVCRNVLITVAYGAIAGA